MKRHDVREFHDAVGKRTAEIRPRDGRQRLDRFHFASPGERGFHQWLAFVAHPVAGFVVQIPDDDPPVLRKGADQVCHVLLHHYTMSWL